MSELPNIDTVQKILENINYRNEKLSKKQVSQLLKLKSDEEPLFTLKDRDFLFEAIGIINELGFEEAVKYFKSKQKVSNRSLILKDSSVFDSSKKRFYLETTRDLRTTEIESYTVCPKCKTNDVETITKQVRRGDEGATNFHRCLTCEYQWRE